MDNRPQLSLCDQAQVAGIDQFIQEFSDAHALLIVNGRWVTQAGFSKAKSWSNTGKVCFRCLENHLGSSDSLAWVSIRSKHMSSNYYAGPLTLEEQTARLPRSLSIVTLRCKVLQL